MTFPEIVALITLPVRSSSDLLHAAVFWFLGRGVPLELALFLAVGTIVAPFWVIVHFLDRLIKNRKQGGAS